MLCYLLYQMYKVIAAKVISEHGIFELKGLCELVISYSPGCLGWEYRVLTVVGPGQTWPARFASPWQMTARDLLQMKQCWEPEHTHPAETW